MNYRHLRGLGALIPALFVAICAVAQAAPTQAVPGSPTNYRYFDRLSTATGKIRPPGTDVALNVPANTRCTSQAKTWVVSGNTCSATTGSTANGVTQNVASNNGNSGIGKFTCTVATNSYAYVASGSTCTPPPPASCTSKLLNWTVGGTTCSGTVSTTPNGNSVGVLASSGANTGTGNFTCNSVSDAYTFVASGSSCNVPPPTTCTNQTKSWTQGGNTCSAPTGTSNANEVKTLTSNNGTLGAGSFTCDAPTNTYTFNSGASNCYPAGCTSQTKGWAVGGVNCAGSTSTNGNGTRKAVSSTNGNNGTANWDCNSSNDTYTLVSSGATCAVPTPPTCAAQTLNWTATTSRGTFSCSASAAQTNDGQTAILSSTNAQMGSANFVCNAGTFAVSGSPTCHPTTCTAQTLGWVQGTPNCAGGSGIVNHGVLKNIVSTNGNNGSGNFTCNAATDAYAFSSAGSTCAVPRPATCANTGVSWSQGGNSCTGGTGVVNDGATARIAATGTNTGTADVTCDSVNGFSVTGLTCTVPTPPPPANCTSQSKSWTVGANTCSGSTGVTTGGTNKVVSATSTNTGNATFTCNNATDTYALQGGATCAPPAPSGGSAYKTIMFDGYSACGVKSDDTLNCWGQFNINNKNAVTGVYNPNPSPVLPGTKFFDPMRIRGNGIIYNNGAGISSYGFNDVDYLLPNAAGSGIISTPVSISSDVYSDIFRQCGRLISGQVKCWGLDKSLGFLGSDADTAPTTVTKANKTQTLPLPTTSNFNYSSLIEISGFAYCGIIPDKTLRCWGQGSQTLNAGDASINAGHSANKFAPLPISVMPNQKFSLITGKVFSAGGITDTNDVVVWGKLPAYGGVGTAGKAVAPRLVAGGVKFKSLSIYHTVMCGISLADDAYCWGNNANNVMGNGASGSIYATPQLVSGGLKFKSIDITPSTMCGVTTSNLLYCWGSNNNGLMGLGGQNYKFFVDTQLTPVLAFGGMQVSKFIHVGGGQAICAVNSADNKWYCAGDNSFGQLGNGIESCQTGDAAFFQANGYCSDVVRSPYKILGQE